MIIKPGVIAIIIKARRHPENLGRTVRVLSHDQRNPGWWLVQALHGTLHATSVMGGRVTMTPVMYCHHTHLMPIGDTPSPEAIADALIEKLTREVKA